MDQYKMMENNGTENPPKLCRFRQQQSATNALQIASLHSTIQKLAHQNRTLYLSIFHQEPSFKFDLYTPQAQGNLSKETQKELKLKQIDRLLDEQEQLNKKKEEVKFKNQSNGQIRVEQATIYSDIRRIFNKYQKSSAAQVDLIEKVDNINKIVCQIKSRVQSERKYVKEAVEGEDYGFVQLYRYEKLQSMLKEGEGELEKIREKVKELEELVLNKNEEICRLREIIGQNEGKLNNLIQSIDENNSRIMSLEQEVKMMKNNKGCEGQVWSSVTNQFELKITCASIDIKAFETERNLAQVIEFLKADNSIKQTKITDSQYPDLPILKMCSNFQSVKKAFSDRNFSKTSLQSDRHRKVEQEYLPQSRTNRRFKRSQNCKWMDEPFCSILNIEIGE